MSLFLNFTNLELIFKNHLKNVRTIWALKSLRFVSLGYNIGEGISLSMGSDGWNWNQRVDTQKNKDETRPAGPCLGQVTVTH